MVMDTQVAESKVEPTFKADKPQQPEARDEKAGDHLETVYVGMLVAVGLAILALFRRRTPA